jgi:hypothetical protein
VRSRSDDEPSGGYALHYTSSYERNFVMRIFVKRGMTVMGSGSLDNEGLDCVGG